MGKHASVIMKSAWAGTRKEENGKETYQGRHYLRCYRQTLFGGREFDTGRKWGNVGFYLKSDYAPDNYGGFKAVYGDKE